MGQSADDGDVGAIENVSVVIQNIGVHADVPHFLARSNTKRFNVEEIRLADVSLQEAIEFD